MRRLIRPPLVVAVVSALTTLGLLELAPTASAAAVCAFDATSGIVTVTLAASETATISRITDSIALNGVACDVATVTTTDTIQVTGAGPSDEVTIDLSGGAFAPGKTSESDGGASEIEFEVNLGVATPIGKVHIIGSSGSDAITFGTGGVNLNAAEAVGDADVTFANPITLDADGRAGDDIISVAGGAGTGTAISGVTIHGGDGNDLLLGEIGGDVFTGDAGTDTVDYSGATQIVSLDLGLGTATLAGGGVPDQLATLENANGSPGDDRMTGDSGANILSGGDGNDTLDGSEGDDTLDGSEGDDTLDGGAGDDTADFHSSSQGVTTDLEAGTATGDGADTLTSIENARGTTFDDTLDGSAGPNTLNGRGGSDELDGLAGNDLLLGRSGDDVLAGGDGRDTLRGGTGKDQLDGGKGQDVCSGGPDPDSWVNCES